MPLGVTGHALGIESRVSNLHVDGRAHLLGLVSGCYSRFIGHQEPLRAIPTLMTKQHRFARSLS
jgi:hypothetical protein